MKIKGKANKETHVGCGEEISPRRLRGVTAKIFGDALCHTHFYLTETDFGCWKIVVQI